MLKRSSLALRGASLLNSVPSHLVRHDLHQVYGKEQARCKLKVHEKGTVDIPVSLCDVHDDGTNAEDAVHEVQAKADRRHCEILSQLLLCRQLLLRVAETLLGVGEGEDGQYMLEVRKGGGEERKMRKGERKRRAKGKSSALLERKRSAGRLSTHHGLAPRDCVVA